jgi:Zn ribbon nucleic-acid-binding protein
MHRDQDNSNRKQASKTIKRAPSADWRTEDLHSLWQRTGTFQFDDAPYSLHDFLQYCVLLQNLRRKFEHDDRAHQFDACAFFLCGGYFAFKYLNLTSSLRLRGAIFGGLRHATQPEHEFAKFIAEIRETVKAAGRQQVELFVCEEVKSGTGMGRAMRIINESMEAASDDCSFSVEFYAIRPGTADQMSDHLRATASKWQGDHKTPTGTLRINITHFAGSLPTYDSPILRGVEVTSTSQDDQEGYEMLKLSDGTVSFWCEQDKTEPVIQIPVQDTCLVEMMSACAVSWTTKSESILTQSLKTSIAGRSCPICKALLQRMQQPMNEKSITYGACHEAGHAFARAKNGDRVLLIDAIERLVTFRTPDWKCGCGGYLHREDSGGVVFNFNPDCKDCDLYVMNLLAANYIGAIATAILMPDEYDPQDAECDYAAAAEFQPPYKDAPEKWKALKLAAAKKAEHLVRISATTILKLRDSTVAAGGRLDGSRAHEIVDSQTPNRS